MWRGFVRPREQASHPPRKPSRFSATPDGFGLWDRPTTRFFLGPSKCLRLWVPQQAFWLSRARIETSAGPEVQSAPRMAEAWDASEAAFWARSPQLG